MHTALCGSNKLRDDERQAIAVGMMNIHKNLFGKIEDVGTELVRSHHILAAVQMLALRLHSQAGGDVSDDGNNGGGGASDADKVNDNGKA